MLEKMLKLFACVSIAALLIGTTSLSAVSASPAEDSGTSSASVDVGLGITCPQDGFVYIAIDDTNNLIDIELGPAFFEEIEGGFDSWCGLGDGELHTVNLLENGTRDINYMMVRKTEPGKIQVDLDYAVTGLKIQMYPTSIVSLGTSSPGTSTHTSGSPLLLTASPQDFITGIQNGVHNAQLHYVIDLTNEFELDNAQNMPTKITHTITASP